MPAILHRVGINASVVKVFKALSEEKGLAGCSIKKVRTMTQVR
jgi:hypothetical protein